MYVVQIFVGRMAALKTMFAYWLFNDDLMFDNWLGTTVNNFAFDPKQVETTSTYGKIVSPVPTKTTNLIMDLSKFAVIEACF